MTQNPCKSCERSKCCNMESEDVIGCAQYMERVPHTNGDRIRAMTDRELAEWIVRKTSGFGFDGYEDEVNAWYEWLKSEVQE